MDYCFKIEKGNCVLCKDRQWRHKKFWDGAVFTQEQYTEIMNKLKPKKTKETAVFGAHCILIEIIN